MTITYPLTFPNVPIKACRFTASSVVSIATSPFTGQQQTQEFSGQWWELQVTLAPLLRAQAEEFAAFLLKLNGRKGTFLFGDPNGATPRGLAAGAPQVNGASQSGNALITDGWTPGVNGILKAGDYVQLGSGSSARLYKQLEDVNSDGSGNATLLLWPSLRTTPGDNDPITVVNTKTRFRMMANNPGWDMQEAGLYGFSFAAIEEL